MRWYRFGADFFVCDCEKRKMYWMYIEFFGKKQAGKDVPKMCRRINQRFLNISTNGLRHIEKRNGEHGVHDKTMANLKDVARLAYVCENADSAEILIDDNKQIMSSE